MTAACWLTLALLPPPGPDLRASADGRHLVRRDGTPFLWLGDTAWELFSRTTRAEAGRYLDDRKAKRFTVIQTAFLALHEGKNAAGHTPVRYRDLQPVLAPDGDYWTHVDWVLDEAAARGFVVAVAPFRQQLLPKNPADAERYARFLGERYGRRPNLVWMVGFDPAPEQIDAHADTYRAVARGIAAGAGGNDRVFLTFHPAGQHSSARWFHADGWLRMNMVQTGHNRDFPSWRLVAGTFARLPAKPVLDAEPTYEGHPLGDRPKDPATGRRPLSDAADVRRSAYANLLSGACGHTYGHHSVWQMYVPGRYPAVYEAKLGWEAALDAPGAAQMRHLRALVESRPLPSRVPDQSLVAGAGDGPVRAARGDGYAFVYTPEGKAVTAVLGKLSGERVRATWFDPRTGAATPAGAWPNTGTREFRPPAAGRGNDWVLVLDDAAKGYPPPGDGR